MTDHRDRTHYSRHYRTSLTNPKPPRCDHTLDTTPHRCTLDAGHTTPHAAVTRQGESGTVIRWT